MPGELKVGEIKSGLDTQFFGSQILIFDEIDSTQDYCLKNIKGLNNGSLVIAEVQYKGRGRLGRIWHSPAQKGIYMSLVLKDSFDRDSIPQLTLLTSVSLANYLNEAYGIEAKTRWPNDVVVEDKKVAGVLAEVGDGAIVVGIGINVNQNLAELPEEATSLFLCLGREEDRNKILREYLNGFERDYLEWKEKGFNYLKENWFRLTSLRGKHVKVKTSGAHIIGIVEDLGYNCKLIIRNESGFHIQVAVEELIMIR